MKKLLFFGLAGLMGFALIQGQNQTQILDSIVSYKINSTLDSIPESKEEYQFDRMGNQIFYGQSFWIESQANWWMWMYDQDSFDIYSNQIEKIQFSGMERGLRFPYVKHSWQLDAYLNPQMENSYYKHEEQDSWITEGQIEIKTDENGKVIQKLIYSWNQDAAMWKPSSLHTFNYNLQDLLSEHIIQNWNQNSYGWYYYLKLESNYFADGLMASEYHYRWTRGKWVKDPDRWKEYDSLGRLIRQKDYNVGALSDVEYQYDSLGNSTILYSSAGAGHSIFHPSFKWIKTVNHHGNLIKQEQLNWTNGVWVPIYITEIVYNEFENPSISISFIWNQDLDSWELTSRKYYYYKTPSSGLPDSV